MASHETPTPLPTALLATGAALLFSAVASAQPKPPSSFETVNVCERVPGADVAKALGGRLVETRPVNVKGAVFARCVYSVEIDKANRALVLWLNPPDDYEGLREAAESRVKRVAGVGDAAHVTQDPDTKRIWFRAVKRGAVTVQVSAEREDWARVLATLALAKF
jgi:hypothetical protein